MNTIELLTRSLNGSAELLKMTLADFSEQEMLTRPCPGANDPLWQLGHSAAAEYMLVNSVKAGAIPELPAGFAARFENDKKTNLVDDPKQLATKQQLVDLFAKTRAATIAFVGTLKESDLDKPSDERFRKFFPTVGDLLSLQATHVSMHMGQIQVARRKLGKPFLF